MTHVHDLTARPVGVSARDRRADAPAGPDARVLALDIGLYGQVGSLSAMFWYAAGGRLHAHQAQLLPDDATLEDQLDMLEAWAEAYPEYRVVAPVVIIGVTVLSPVLRRQVRAHLDAWYTPPHRRRLVTIGDYAGEQQGEKARGVTPRKKLRDLLSTFLSRRAITLTESQAEAVAKYTGRREPPGRDGDDEWRVDAIDAIAVPVALTCMAAAAMLPPPLPTAADHARHLQRAMTAWQLQMPGLTDADALDRALRLGHPRQQLTPVAPTGPGPAPSSFALPDWSDGGAPPHPGA